MRLKFARSQIRTRHVADLLLIRGLFLLSLFFHLIEVLFGRVLARVCEAQFRLYAEECKQNFVLFLNFHCHFQVSATATMIFCS